MYWIRAFLAIACLVASTVPDSRAGTVIVVDSEVYTQPTSKGTATLYMEKKRMRIDSTEGGADYTVIYWLGENDEPSYWLIDRRASTYVEMTHRDMERIRAGVKQSRDQVGKQIKSLTPERRRQMQRLYQRPLEELGLSTSPPEYKKVATGTRLSEWTCDHYEGYRDGEKREEVWAAGWEALGISREDVAIFGDMADMFEGTGQQLPAFYSFAKGDAPGVDGFPIMVVAYQDGSPKEKSRVREVRRERIDPQLFELPEGLTKKNIGQWR